MDNIESILATSTNKPTSKSSTTYHSDSKEKFSDMLNDAYNKQGAIDNKLDQFDQDNKLDETRNHINKNHDARASNVDEDSEQDESSIDDQKNKVDSSQNLTSKDKRKADNDNIQKSEDNVASTTGKMNEENEVAPEEQVADQDLQTNTIKTETTNDLLASLLFTNGLTNPILDKTVTNTPNPILINGSAASLAQQDVTSVSSLTNNAEKIPDSATASSATPQGSSSAQLVEANHENTNDFLSKLSAAQINMKNNETTNSFHTAIEGATDKININSFLNTNDQAGLLLGSTVQQAYSAHSSSTLVPTLNIAATLKQPEWSNQVAEKVIWLNNQGLQSAELTLTPAELGTLHAKITLENGKMSLSFVAPSPEVRQVLENNLTQLRDNLQQDKIDLANVSVSDYSNSKEQFFKQNFVQSSDGNLSGGEESMVRMSELPSKTISNRMIDYYT